MTGTSPRFGLTTLTDGDELSANDYAFGRANRYLLDRLLAEIVENHEHTGRPAPTAPAAPPLLSLNTTGGVFGSNRTLLYRIGLVDHRGQEFVASQQASIVTSPPVATPAPPTLSQALGGSLQAGEYLYLLTAYTDSTGYETLPSRAATGTLTEGNYWTVTFPPLPPGATGWNLYRKSPTDLEPLFLGTTTDTIDHLDNGDTAPNPHRSLPTTNTTNSTSSVTVNTSDPLPTGFTAKIYRTSDQSDWSRSLIARVASLPYTDTGHATQTGAPLARSVGFGGAPKIRLGIDTTGTLPPATLIHSELVTFAFAGPVEVGISPWQWICDYDQAEIISVRATLGRGSVPASTPVKANLEYRTALGAWTPILAPYETTAAEFTVPVGESIGTLAHSGFDFVTVTFNPGHALRATIVGTGGGTPATDSDLSLVVTMSVRHGSAATTYTWKDD